MRRCLCTHVHTCMRAHTHHTHTHTHTPHARTHARTRTHTQRNKQMKYSDHHSLGFTLQGQVLLYPYPLPFLSSPVPARMQWTLPTPTLCWRGLYPFLFRSTLQGRWWGEGRTLSGVVTLVWKFKFSVALRPQRPSRLLGMGHLNFHASLELWLPKKKDERALKERVAGCLRWVVHW